MAATDETGAILWAEHFTPYGENFPGPAANPDDEGFTGHIQDTDTGLTYMEARYYDPVIGRFLSDDPVGFAKGGVAQFNRYTYGNNDPINMFDPNGQDAFLVSRSLGHALAKGKNHMFVFVRNNETGAI